jgi:hypothetical protein
LLSEKDAIERAYGALSCVAETTMAKSEDLRRSASDAFVNIQLITSLTTCTLHSCTLHSAWFISYGGRGAAGCCRKRS